MYERFVFYQRKQKEGESFDVFHVDIKRLVKNCEFGDKESEMLRDQIVMGVVDKKLQMRLLEVPNLTYEIAVDKSRASEATTEQALSMNKTENVCEIRSQNKQSNATFRRQPNSDRNNNNNHGSMRQNGRPMNRRQISNKISTYSKASKTNADQRRMKE